jgi:plastocyanin
MLPGSLAAILLAAAWTAAPAQPSSEATGAVEGAIRVTAGRRADNSVVYLRGVPAAVPAATAPGAGLPAAVMDQQGNAFIPHILPVVRGQAVRFGNQDPFMHNVHIFWSDRSMFNHSQTPQGSSDWTPGRAGEYIVRCDIHPEMLAFVFVFDHPFFADAGPGSGTGEFRIERVPPGEYTLAAVRSQRGKLVTQEHPVRVRAGETAFVEVTF